MEQNEQKNLPETEKTGRPKRDATAETALPGGFEQQWKRRKRRRMVGIVIGVLVVLIVGVFVYQGYRYLQKLNTEADESVSTTSYRVQKAVTGSIETTLSSSGQLEPIESETLISLYDGEAEEVTVSVGDTVSEGDTLIRLSSDTIEQERDALLDELDSIHASMADTDELNSSRTILAGISGIVKDIHGEVGELVEDVVAEYGYLCLISTDGRMQVKLETDQLKKYDTVTVNVSDTASPKGVVSDITDGVASIYINTNTYPVGQQVTVQDESGEAIGAGTLELVEYIRVVGDEGVIARGRVYENMRVWKKSIIVVLEGYTHTGAYVSLAEERDAVLEQLDELDEAQSITAPFDGRIMELNVQEGDEIALDQTLLVIASSAGYTVSLSVDELDITQLAVGQTATLELDAMDGEFEGIVTRLSYTNSSTSSVARYAVTVETPDIKGALPGMSVTCTVITASSGAGITVPVDAVQTVNGQDMVYLAPEDAMFGRSYTESEIDLSLLTAVPVETGMSNGTTILITGEIEDGSLILVPEVTTSATYEEDEESVSFFGMGGMQDGSMPRGGANMPGFSGSESGSGAMRRNEGRDDG